MRCFGDANNMEWGNSIVNDWTAHHSGILRAKARRALSHRCTNCITFVTVCWLSNGILCVKLSWVGDGQSRAVVTWWMLSVKCEKWPNDRRNIWHRLPHITTSCDWTRIFDWQIVRFRSTAMSSAANSRANCLSFEFVWNTQSVKANKTSRRKDDRLADSRCFGDTRRSEGVCRLKATSSQRWKLRQILHQTFQTNLCAESIYVIPHINIHITTNNPKPICSLVIVNSPTCSTRH